MKYLKFKTVFLLFLLTIFSLAITSSNVLADYGETITVTPCGISGNPGGSGESLGGNSNTTPQGTGHGYNNDQGENEWAGYAHHVGLEYVKVGSKSSGHWYGDKIWPISSIPNHKDFRVKLKRKGGVD